MQSIDKQENNSNRIIWLDMARCFAIVMVVLCHAVETSCKLDNHIWNNTSFLFRLFRIAGFTLGRLGVPFFLFLSGYLVLNRLQDSDEKVVGFYSRKLLNLLITVEVWNFFYYFFEVYYLHRNNSILSLIKQCLFLEKSGLSHMWYMPMILGLYISVPFLSLIVRNYSMKSIGLPLATGLIAFFVLPSVDLVIKTVNGNFSGLNLIIDLSFLGGIYGIYLILGYYVYRTELLKKISTIIVFLCVGSLYIITVFIQYWTYSKGKGYNVWYNFITLFLCSIFLFELFRRLKYFKCNKLLEKVVTTISKVSLGIYFFHKPIQIVLINLMMNENKIVVSLITFITSFVISLLTCIIIAKNKYLGKYLLFLNN